MRTSEAHIPYSPASIAKAYLGLMGVRPMGGELRGVPLEQFGVATSAFYAGRAEARIRKTPVPAVITDFRSMYPTLFGIELCRCDRTH